MRLSIIPVVAFVVCGALTALADPSAHFSAMPGDCPELCGTIDSCAAKANRADLSDLLCHMARCETGDTCRAKIRSPSGRFHGPFQFLPKTWKRVCVPVFHREKIAACGSLESMQDTCCATICAAEIIATNRNGGIRNWPSCGRKAKRTLAAEKASRSPDVSVE